MMGRHGLKVIGLGLVVWLGAVATALAWTSRQAPGLDRAVLLEQDWQSIKNTPSSGDSPVASESLSQPTDAAPVALPLESPTPVSAPVVQPVVVSASQSPLSIAENASSVTIITRADLDRMRALTLADVLRQVPGVTVVQAGGPGQLTYALIRGAASERTQVTVNGLPCNDPISPARAADLSLISLDNVERIEIVRGPQSVLFGSGAMGGVINLITAGPERSWSGRASAEGGSYTSAAAAADARGFLGPLGISLGTSWKNTAGFSAAADPGALPADADGERRASADLTLEWQPDQSLRLVLDGRAARRELDLDGFGGVGGDDPNYATTSALAAGRFSANWDVSDRYQQTGSIGFSRLDRAFRNDPDPGHPEEAERSEWRGDVLTLDWKHLVRAGSCHTLSLGAEYRQEYGQSRNRRVYLDWWTFQPTVDLAVFTGQSAHSVGWFAEDVFRWQDWTVVLGGRYDVHDQFGGVWTYRVTPTWQFGRSGWRVKSTLGTAFNAPSLYQRYSVYGFEGLKAEQSVGWDAGLEKVWDQPSLSAEVRYFRSDYRDQIAFYTDPLTFQSTYVNLGQVRIQGIEAVAASQTGGWADFRLAVTRLWAQDITLGEEAAQPLLRRAEYQAGLGAAFRLAGLVLDLDLQRVGPRPDADYDPVTYLPRSVQLAPYTLFNATLSAPVTSGITAYLRLHNLLDAVYQDILGYQASRFAAYAGAVWEWR